METTPLPTGGVVVGVDGSESADRALAWAAEEAALDHRPLVLVHAVGTLGTPGTVWLTEADELVQEMREHGGKLLADAAQDVARRHPCVEVHTCVVTQDARQALLHLADDAQMIVVGSRGRGPIRSLVLGSVSAAVARHAGCPVGAWMRCPSRWTSSSSVAGTPGPSPVRSSATSPTISSSTPAPWSPSSPRPGDLVGPLVPAASPATAAGHAGRAPAARRRTTPR
jgi:nucleotide-binding universal stress UspA family protein